MTRKQSNTLFLSHGGGPLPLLGDAGHKEMIDCLQTIAQKLPKPEAILVISAHWEETMPTITVGKNPSLIYDYYNFPPESYEIKYPCVGEPGLAKEVYELLGAANIEAKLDESRGYDHGLFIPLKIMHPNADIPCIQLSLDNSLDPEQHINIGKALQPLSDKNILVIGSGFSFHNMQAFFKEESDEEKGFNLAFEEWLIETCSDKALSEAERRQRLINWEQAKGARYCHPREEHLLPLYVCYGFAQTHCSEYFELNILNKKASMYLW